MPSPSPAPCRHYRQACARVTAGCSFVHCHRAYSQCINLLRSATVPLHDTFPLAAQHHIPSTRPVPVGSPSVFGETPTSELAWPVDIHCPSPPLCLAPLVICFFARLSNAGLVTRIYIYIVLLGNDNWHLLIAAIVPTHIYFLFVFFFFQRNVA